MALPAAAPLEHRAGFPRLGVLPGGEPAAAERKAAVIDLGSNSWRLVVFAYVPGATWRRVGELSEPVRIAEGLSASGRLSTGAIARGIETLEIFERYLGARGLPRGAVDAVATSAIRDAENGAELLTAVRERTSLDIAILSAEEEARLGYIAAVNSTTLADGVVLDLGGGSLQLTGVAERRAQRMGSWPLGAVRVTERLLAGSGPVPRKQLKRARAAVLAELADARWVADSGRRLVGMGGAVRNLAAAAQRLRGDATSGIQGFLLERETLRELVQELAGRPPAERALPGIKATRADVVLGSAVVLDAVLEHGGFAGIEVTRSGLREGVFFQRRLLPGGGAAARRRARGRDPQPRAAVRQRPRARRPRGAARAPAPRLARRRRRRRRRARGARAAVGGGPAARHRREHRLRRPGGPRALPDPQRGHRRLRPARDRADRPDRAPPAQGLARAAASSARGDAELVGRCALLLRLAEQLDRGQDQSVRAARLVPEAGDLRLSVEGDDRLARWSLERRLSDGAFKRAFGGRLVVSP